MSKHKRHNGGTGPTSSGMSDFEFSLIVASNGFFSWVVRCMKAAGVSNLSATDVLVLHAANHRARNRKLADISLVMNLQDTHVVAYSLKKLEGIGLVKQDPSTRAYCTTSEGDAVCARYYRVRKQCLLDAMSFAGDSTLGEITVFLKRLSSHYEQAARTATVIASEQDDPMPRERD